MGVSVTNLAMWSLIVGTLMPPVLALIQQPRWSNTVRSVVMVIASIVVGAGTAYFENDQVFVGKSIVQSVLTVMVAAIATYHGFWKPTEIAPTIEKATSTDPV